MEEKITGPFCNIPIERIALLAKYWMATFDQYPVSPGHMLLIPKRHCKTFFDLNKSELDELSDFIFQAKEYLANRLPKKPDGYNIGCNCGEAAGQTVMHMHMHLIPRYAGDVENPRGGVRGVIPNKQKY